jgi:hypothetical protein
MARQERLMVLATYRSDELHSQHPLRTALAELDRSWHLEHLELARFTPAELAALVGNILGHPPPPVVLQRIFTRSRGTEVLRVGGGPGLRNSGRGRCTARPAHG